MADHLLQTKLYIPPHRQAMVPRPRLIERLRAGLDRKLTLVSVPAGFGKTTLLSDWIHTGIPDWQIAWLSLDEDDNDLGRFFTYLIAAFERTEPDLGSTLSAVFQAATAPQPKPLISALIHEMERRQTRLILFLDDYHVIHTQDPHSALGSLIDHLPYNVHLVVSGRIEPPLPLSRQRVRGQLNEIRSTDLRFTLPDQTALHSILPS
jgi:LuxR family maltose regulon positive regulatory protein